MSNEEYKQMFINLVAEAIENLYSDETNISVLVTNENDQATQKFKLNVKGGKKPSVDIGVISKPTGRTYGFSSFIIDSHSPMGDSNGL